MQGCVRRRNLSVTLCEWRGRASGNWTGRRPERQGVGMDGLCL